MEAPDLESSLKINDRIYRVVLMSQSILVLFVLVAFLGGSYFRQIRGDRTKVDALFFSAEAEITGELFIYEAVPSGDPTSLKAVRKLQSDLIANGLNARVELFRCKEIRNHFRVYTLRLGEKQLDFCAGVDLRNDLFLKSFFQGVIALVVSIAVSLVFWRYYRKSMMEKVLLPIIKEIEVRRVDSALGKLAQQVAHDIRSPLAALKSFSLKRNGLSGDDRNLLRSAVDRIADISNNLLVDQSRMRQSAFDEVKEAERGVYAIGPITEEIVSEKRLELARMDKAVEIEVTPSDTIPFVNINSALIKRGISNVLNNAIEACNEKGRVSISILVVQRSVQIEVIDNGKGIDPKNLPFLFKAGASFQKSGGLGLGLHFTKRVLEAFGGNVEIDSTFAEGTRVSIRLPLADPPTWFKTQLCMSMNMDVVIVDDDPTMHRFWDMQISQAFKGMEKKPNVVHCYDPAGLRLYLTRPRATTSLFLIDYNLSGHDDSGISLVRELNISQESVIVTGMSEETDVRLECESLGVPIIPKSLVHNVPINVT
jgi:signal transduction histidine kinase